MSVFSKPKLGSGQDHSFVVQVGACCAHVVMDGHGGLVGSGLGAHISPLFFTMVAVRVEQVSAPPSLPELVQAEEEPEEQEEFFLIPASP